MADEVRLIDANDYRKRRCRTCINRVQCDNGGNLCFDIMVLNTCPTIEAEPDNGWISVKDRLPEPYENVLVFGNLDGIVTYRVDYLDDYGRWFRTFYVTHWKPLPEPPKEVENETD